MRIIVKAMAVGALALGMSGGFVSFDTVTDTPTVSASTVKAEKGQNNKKNKAASQKKKTVSKKKATPKKKAVSKKKTPSKQAVKNQKIKNIKKDNAKRINKAKAVKVRKDNAAKAVKKNDKALKSLYAQKAKEQKNIASLSRTVAAKTPRVHVATPNTDSNNPHKAYQGKHLITRRENLPTKIVNPKVPRSKQNNATTFAYYGYQKTAADKTAKINGKLTEKQQKEISNYSLTLVNSYLKSQGLAPVKRSNAMDTNMKKLINRRETAKLGFNHTDWGFAEKTFTKKTGLDYAGENLGGILADDSTTMLELKVGVLNSITTMIYQDGYAKWGHRELFKKSAGKHVSGGIEQNRGHYSNWFGYMFVFGLANQRGNVKVQPAAISFASTYRKNLAPRKETANLAAAKKRLAAIDRQIKARNGVLDRNMKKKFAANRAEFNKTKSAADKIMIAKLKKV